MTGIEPARPQLRPSSCQPWGFWTTTAYALASVAAWTLFQWFAATAVLAWLGVGPKATASEVEAIGSHGLTIALATIASMPAALAVIAVAVRRAHCSMPDYLALRWPSSREALVGVAILAVALPLGDLSSYLTGRDLVPAFVVDAYRTARASGHIVVLAIALVAAAPLMEEVLFRGFLFRGYCETRLGPIGAIAVTAAAWAAMHVQYELFYVSQIFLLGCLFGWLRWRSHSTVLTFMLHALVNLTALLQVAYLAERTS